MLPSTFSLTPTSSAMSVQCVSLNITNDQVRETEESFFLAVASSTYIEAPGFPLQVVIEDDDGMLIVMVVVVLFTVVVVTVVLFLLPLLLLLLLLFLLLLLLLCCSCCRYYYYYSCFCCCCYCCVVPATTTTTTVVFVVVASSGDTFITWFHCHIFLQQQQYEYDNSSTSQLHERGIEAHDFVLISN